MRYCNTTVFVLGKVLTPDMAEAIEYNITHSVPILWKAGNESFLAPKGYLRARMDEAEGLPNPEESVLFDTFCRGTTEAWLGLEDTAGG